MSLKGQAISGVKWTTLSTLCLTVIQLAQLAVLARFLQPTDFGLMAIMMIVIGFSQAFMDMGISNAIIQRQHISHTQLSSLYWLNIASGLVLCLIVAAISPFVALFYDEPRIQNLMLWLSSVFLIVGIGNQYRVLCQKALQFSRMAKIEMLSGFLSFAVAVTLAVMGYGVYALVFAMLTQAFVSSACYLFVGLREFHRPALLYRHKELEGFYGFGLYQMGERSVNYISAHIDKLLIGKMVGMQALGFYEMAWRLIIFPLQKINPIINKVAFPVYAMVQNDRAALEKYYSFNVKALSLVITPILAFLAFFSCDVVLVVFGEGWEQTASLIAILAFVGVGKALGNPGGALILAKGRADIGFWWNIFWSVVVSITLFTVLFFVPDIEMVAYALLGLSLSVGLIWHYLISKIRQIRYLPIALHFCRIILVCFGIAWAVSQLENFLSVEIAIVRIAMGGFICLLIYLPYLWFFEKEIIKRLRKDS